MIICGGKERGLKMENRNYQKYGQFLIIGVAIVLASVQFLFNRGFYQDEACLAVSIVGRGFGGLLKPLEFGQSAPIGYLVVEKMLSMVIPAEYGLRVFPLLCFIASLFVLRKMALTLLENETTVTVALALFAFNSQMIYRATMAKQYSGDVFFSLLLVWATLNMGEGVRASPSATKWRVCCVAAVGAIGVWFSNALLIMLVVCGVYLAFRWAASRFTKTGFLRIAIVAAAWGASFGIYYALFISGEHSVKEFMFDYWKHGNPSFMPLSGIGVMASFVALKLMILASFFYGWSSWFAVLACLFIIGLIFGNRRRHMAVIWFTFGGGLVALTLSAMELYPFYERFLLFTLPFGNLPVAQGAAEVIARIRRPAIRAALICVIPVVAFVLAVAWFPIRHCEITDAARFVKEHIEPGDIVLVERKPHFLYYKTLGKKVFAWDNATEAFDDSQIESYSSLVPEFIAARTENLQGRVWILASMAFPLWKAQCYDYKPDEKDAWMDDIINSIPSGTKLMEYRTTGAVAVLFDFGR